MINSKKNIVKILTLHHIHTLFVQFIQLVRSLQDNPHVLGKGMTKSLKVLSDLSKLVKFFGKGKGGNRLAGSMGRQLYSEILAPSHSQPFVATQA